MEIVSKKSKLRSLINVQLECVEMARNWKGVFLGLLIPGIALTGATHHVPSDYPTIQAAIDVCQEGDMVLVAPGLYTGEGNRDIELKGQSVTVRGQGGPEACVIDCQGSEDEPHRGFLFYDGKALGCILDGFTITGGYVHGNGGAICGAMLRDNEIRPRTTVTVMNCIIKGNAAHMGGGIYIAFADARVYNCLVLNNLGGGVRIDRTALAKIINCTVVGNQISSGSAGIAMGTEGGRTPVLVSNCIIWNNTSLRTGRDLPFHQPDCLSLLGCIALQIENSCFPALGEPDGIDVKEYPHNIIYQSRSIHVDPQFADPNRDDYHLKSHAGRWNPVTETWVRDEVTSPCIDTGDPYSPIGREPFPNGGIVNMGVYGGTAEASKSYFNTKPCETVMAGDINGDCKVDFLDLQILSSHWLLYGN